jgi:hypothetical protein
MLEKVKSIYSLNYLPLGFVQMIVPDNGDFNRQTYDFKFVRREFLGDVRCYVIDVFPKKGSGSGRFIGRIWAEDQGYNIIRFNGTYSGSHGHRRFLHFDSWRLNMHEGQWLPAYIYSEESDLPYGFGIARHAKFKSQTRLWGYDLQNPEKQEEFSQILVDAPNAVKDRSEQASDLSPVESTRAWERQAEDNVLERLEHAGLLAPDGEVDKVLQTVVNNLEITNKLDIQPEVRCRVLLTAPLESFNVGHTIIISRGLLDVLPDEATLAAVLAHELAHIELGHKLDTRYAFTDRMMFPDEATYRRFRFHHNEHDETQADQRAVVYMKNSPYADKMQTVGLFARVLQQREKELPFLLRAHLGDTMIVGKDHVRMSAFANSAPQLQKRNLQQIPALPLGSRIKVDPWSDRIDLQKNKPVALQAPSEKMSFEVTPIFPYVTRFGAPAEQAPATAAVNK